MRFLNPLLGLPYTRLIYMLWIQETEVIDCVPKLLKFNAKDHRKYYFPDL